MILRNISDEIRYIYPLRSNDLVYPGAVVDPDATADVPDDAASGLLHQVWWWQAECDPSRELAAKNPQWWDHEHAARTVAAGGQLANRPA